MDVGRNLVAARSAQPQSEPLEKTASPHRGTPAGCSGLFHKLSPLHGLQISPLCQAPTFLGLRLRELSKRDDPFWPLNHVTLSSGSLRKEGGQAKVCAALWGLPRKGTPEPGQGPWPTHSAASGPSHLQSHPHVVNHRSHPGVTLDSPVTCLFPPCVQAMVKADTSFS